jgi:hypothetical protein
VLPAAFLPGAEDSSLPPLEAKTACTAGPAFGFEEDAISL